MTIVAVCCSRVDAGCSPDQTDGVDAADVNDDGGSSTPAAGCGRCACSRHITSSKLRLHTSTKTLHDRRRRQRSRRLVKKRRKNLKGKEEFVHTSIYNSPPYISPIPIRNSTPSHPIARTSENVQVTCQALHSSFSAIFFFLYFLCWLSNRRQHIQLKNSTMRRCGGMVELCSQ